MIKCYAVDDFTHAYLMCALWASNDESDEEGGDPMGINYYLSDISDKTIVKAIADCTKFQSENAEALSPENCTYAGCPTTEYAGYNFWLTRNGHGCGFWDGNWIEPAGTQLTDAAHAFGEIDFYVSDDGQICC